MIETNSSDYGIFCFAALLYLCPNSLLLIRSVVSALCVGLAETITTVGPGLLDNRGSLLIITTICIYYSLTRSTTELENISNIALQILEQKALCQQDPDQDEDDEPLEDQAEYDSVLISSAGDLVAALANALGTDFTQAFGTFFPLISKFYVSFGINVRLDRCAYLAVQKKNRSLSDRASAIGTLAEIISGMKSAVSPFTQALMELFYEALNDPDAEVHSNAAFASGLLVENSDVDLAPQYLPLLTRLRPHFDVAPDAPSAKFNARDNAAGAVARLILRNTAAVPLEQVLPVLIGVLPLKNDYLENRPVFRAIFHLFKSHTQAILPFIDQLLPVFAHVLDPSSPDQLGDEVRAELLNLLKLLNAEIPGKLQAGGLGPYL